MVVPARRGPTIRTAGVSERASPTRRCTSGSNMLSPNLGHSGLWVPADWETATRCPERLGGQAFFCGGAHGLGRPFLQGGSRGLGQAQSGALAVTSGHSHCLLCAHQRISHNYRGSLRGLSAVRSRAMSDVLVVIAHASKHVAELSLPAPW